MTADCELLPLAEEIPPTPAEALWSLVPPAVRRALAAQEPREVTTGGRAGAAAMVAGGRLLVLAPTLDGRVRCELVGLGKSGAKALASAVAYADEVAGVLAGWARKVG